VNEISATEAARRFADLLDAVEHRGERVTIVRRGRRVAQIEPIVGGRGSEVKALLRRHRVDDRWSDDLRAVRSLVDVEERS
jgi:prevent-host-death family protein